MSSPVADAAAAYCAFLRSAVGDQLAPAAAPGMTRAVPAVFRPDLPKWFDGSMPAACIVVRPAGGYTRFGGGLMYLADPRLDVVCYGSNQHQATSLARLVAVESKQLMVQVWENTLLHACNIAGGPVPLPDQQTLWPACWLAVQVVHGELPVWP